VSSDDGGLSGDRFERQPSQRGGDVAAAQMLGKRRQRQPLRANAAPQPGKE
jgi:hypothetical protein